MLRVLRGTLVVSVLWLLMSGCGPIKATSEIGNAESALDVATAANAEELAPYEYFMAQELLRKAREEWGYSDFEMSAEYAERSKKFSDEARQKASTDPWKGPPKSAIEGMTEPKSTVPPAEGGE